MARKVKTEKAKAAAKPAKTAKPRKPKTAAAPPTPAADHPQINPTMIPKANFLRLIKELGEMKGTMDEANGRLKSRTDNAVAQFNVHPEALKIARKYAKREPVRGCEFLRHVRVYFDYLGLANEDVDLFAGQAAAEAGAAFEDETGIDVAEPLLDAEEQTNVSAIGRGRKPRIVDITDEPEAMTDLERQLLGPDAA
jgi:hypothetical protein